MGRTAPPPADRLEAARTRYDGLASQGELRVSKAWELAELARHVVALSLHRGVDLDATAVLGLASQAAGVAAMASSPRASDLTLGRVTARRPERMLAAVHERRPIDPMDFFGAFTLATLMRDRPVVAALARAIEDVDPDPPLSSRVTPERDLFRRALAALASAARGHEEEGRALAAAAIPSIEGALVGLDDFRAARFHNLVLPLLRGLSAEDAVEAVGRAAALHDEHYAEPIRADEPDAVVPWGALALAAIRGLSSSDVRFADGAVAARMLAPLLDVEPEPTSLTYDTPSFVARTMDEALLRVELSSPGEIAVVEQSPLAENKTDVRIEARDVVCYRYLVTIDEQAPSCVDAGELVHMAERAIERAASLPVGDEERESAKAVARSCASAALGLLGDQEELFRDRMTSPLGRALCDAQPEKFTRAALSALVASVDALP